MAFYKITRSALLAALLVAGFSACVKTEFDEPPSTPITVDITPNTKIADLKKLHVTPEGFDPITDDLIITGKVVMDDRSGNYYKTIVIQDETGGIEVKFNDGYLFNQFPIGRQIYIKCKGLILTDYNGLTQLIGSTLEEAGVLSSVGLTEAQVITNVVKGNYAATPVAPRVVSLAQLDESMVSTLIQLDDVQFVKADTGKTWADAVTKNSVNRKLESCNGLSTLVRTSGYADFAAQKVPGGKGSLVGVLGVYNGDYQLYIRNPNDAASLTADRCGSGPQNNFTEDFAGITTDNAELDVAGWTNVAVSGTKKWSGEIFSSQRYAQASAFQSNQTNMEAWLISPKLTLTTAKFLQFESAMAYWKHDGLKVYISNNFNGTDPKAPGTTWTELDCDLAGQATANHTWVPSGVISLPIYATGFGHIAFVYTGNSSAQTTDYRIDNVKVQ